MSIETRPGIEFTEHTNFATEITPVDSKYFRRVSAFGADTDLLGFKNSEGVEIVIPLSRISAIQNLATFITAITTSTTCTHVYTSE